MSVDQAWQLSPAQRAFKDHLLRLLAQLDPPLRSYRLEQAPDGAEGWYWLVTVRRGTLRYQVAIAPILIDFADGNFTPILIERIQRELARGEREGR